MEELTQQLSQLKPLKPQSPVVRPLVSDTEEDNQGETEIMYPNPASISGLRRKSTIKVLNCDKPKAKPARESPTSNETDSGTESEKLKKDESVTVELSKLELLKQELGQLAKLDSVPTNQVSKFSNADDNKQEVTKVELTNSPPSGTSVENTADELKVTPIGRFFAATGIDKSVSVDSGLSNSAVNGISTDQSASTRTLYDQSKLTSDIVATPLTNGTMPALANGSVTLPRPLRPAVNNVESSMTHSASLPRPKEKSKARKSSTRKSASSILLSADADRDRLVQLLLA